MPDITSRLPTSAPAPAPAKLVQESAAFDTHTTTTESSNQLPTALGPPTHLPNQMLSARQTALRGTHGGELTITTNARSDFEQRIKALKLNPQLPLQRALEEKCSWHGEMTQTLHVYRVGNEAVLVSTKGLKEDRIYDIVTVPDRRDPSVKTFLSGIRQDLRILCQLMTEKKYKSPEYAQAEWNLSVGLFKSYFGEPGQPGLRYVRFADPELNELLCQIDRAGIESWMCDKAESWGSDVLLNGLISYKNNMLYEFFTTTGELPNLEDVALEHSTHGSIVSGVIDAKGLLPSEQIAKVGLAKLTGVTGRESDSRTDSDRISFFDHSNAGKKELFLGYGGLPGGFDFPISFTVNNEKASQLELHNGAMRIRKEKTLKDRLPIDLIDKVFAPWFIVNDLQRVFNQHGHDHIKVMEFRRKPE